MSLKKYQNTSLKSAREQGFTIVELLIVVIVIAILATLVISAYTGIQNKAKANTNRSNAKALATAVQAYATEEPNNGTYPATLTVLDNAARVVRFTAPADAQSDGNADSTHGIGFKKCTGNGVQVTWYDTEAGVAKIQQAFGAQAGCTAP